MCDISVEVVVTGNLAVCTSSLLELWRQAVRLHRHCPIFTTAVWSASPTDSCLCEAVCMPQTQQGGAGVREDVRLPAPPHGPCRSIGVGSSSSWRSWRGKFETPLAPTIFRRPWTRDRAAGAEEQRGERGCHSAKTPGQRAVVLSSEAPNCSNSGVGAGMADPIPSNPAILPTGQAGQPGHPL